MNPLLEVCLVALTLAISVTPSVAVQAAVTASSSFAGTWEGTTNGLPGVELKILETAGNVTGGATFYFQKRDDANSPWHVAGETSVPLLAPHVDGKTLTFEVQHHRCHTCSELGPNVKFRLVLVEPSEARLWNLSEAKLSDPGLTLNRRTEQSADTTPALQKGISVEMPATRNAVPVPDADQEDSWIVAMTQDGHIYLRVDPITEAALTAELKARMSNNADRKLYIKADARTLYDKVVNVLDAARAAGVESVILLTSQPGPTQPGAWVSPKGLEVQVGARSHYGPDVAVVNVLRSGQQGPKLIINNKPIPWASLQTTLADVLQNQVRKVVLVSAEGTLPFSDVVKMTDACISTKADVVLVRSEAQ
jgi:biopolymer transport protein ExbD